jgi:hypothetical protein
MQLRPLVLTALVLAAAATLTRALVVRDGVGPIEYVVGAAVVFVLLLAAFRLSRRAIRRA